MKKIVLLNVYGRKNIGDEAILTNSLNLLKLTFKNLKEIDILFTNKDENLAKIDPRLKINKLWSPYGQAIYSTLTPLSDFAKIIRFINITFTSCILVFINNLVPLKRFTSKQFSYITAIYKADIVIGMGGGYLRTKNKFKDFFGLLLVLLPVFIAKCFRKPILFLPISFGNFASRLHKRISYQIIKNTSIICRDQKSLKDLKLLTRKEDRTKLYFSPDVAIYSDTPKIIDERSKFSSNYIVLTAREWLSDNKQNLFEMNLKKFILSIWKKYKLKTYFVAMANNSIEDNDLNVFNRISQNLSDKSIFLLSRSKSPAAVQKILNKAKMAVCMRMHSAILAVTVNTPFITMGYEFKTLSMMKFLKLKDYHIELKDVSSQVLENQANKLLRKTNYQNLYQTLETFNLGKKEYKKMLLKFLKDTLTKSTLSL